jgi:uncharacterized membrane protein YgcG
MNKRSAIVVAAGLVLALVAGGFALTNGLTGPEPSAAVASAKAPRQKKPIVHTITRTIKVHKKAPQPTSGPPTVPTAAGSTTTRSGTSFTSDDGGSHGEAGVDSSGSDDGGSDDSGGGDD